jgi:predicted nucleotide-binding protein
MTLAENSGQRDKVCFLIAPIGGEGTEVRRRSDMMLRHVIEPAASARGYSVLRADQINSPGQITSQILRLVLEAPLAIADISGLNPNVMYELGVRHAAGKPVIQITGRGEVIPFDVAGIRTLIVDLSVDSAAKARQDLERMIAALAQDTATVDSPVAAATDVAVFERIDERLGAAASPIFSVLKDLDSRLGSLERRITRNTEPIKSSPQYSRRVFIIHGHDGELKNELARLLQRLEFEPVILHERPDRGQTIIAKLTGEMSDVGFAFVLLTPDDVGAVAAKKDDLNLRARQNVIFEHGLFVGSLTPARVCAIRRGDVETPSDLQGVLYKSISEGGGISSIALEIVNELKSAGYVIDANKLLEQ